MLDAKSYHPIATSINQKLNEIAQAYTSGIMTSSEIKKITSDIIVSEILKHQEIKKNIEQQKVLNLFAYTGGASLAAAAAGAETYHVDSIKQVVSWANRNMESSQLKDIRWVVEDAVKFVKREVKRGKIYQGIILDPPAYGHGTDGEKWKLEEQINEMIFDVLSLLDKQHHFFILNTYSLGFSSLIIENLMQDNLKKAKLENIKPEYGELYIPSSTQQKLPLGVYCRF